MNATNISELEYSVVVPVYNSSKTLSELVEQVDRLFVELGSSYELIMVDDGSKDSSWAVMKELQGEYPSLKIIRLRRNFGQHNAIMCGFNLCRGRHVITIDDDLQNPPEEIPKLIDKLNEGYDVVYGIYEEKKHSLTRNYGSAVIGWYYRKIFDMDNRISAFRIMTQEIVREVIRYDKNFPYIDGLISWNTKEIGEVSVKHSVRKEGRSGYTLRKILKLSFNMITNFSAFPIRVASLLGILFSIFGFCLGMYFIVKAFVIGIPVTGYASLIVAITIFSGVQLLTIGVIGEYIARVHMNINKKPQYVIREH